MNWKNSLLSLYMHFVNIERKEYVKIDVALMSNQQRNV